MQSIFPTTGFDEEALRRIYSQIEQLEETIFAYEAAYESNSFTDNLIVFVTVLKTHVKIAFGGVRGVPPVLETLDEPSRRSDEETPTDEDAENPPW